MKMQLLWISVVCFALHAGAQHKKAKEMKIPDLPPVADLQGHRGCRGLMPENTIAGMIKALELGVNTLEMDVVITADKQVILSHEPFFNHEISTMPDGSEVTEAMEKNLNIYKMTYAEVKRYDVGMKVHPRFPEQQKMPAVKPLLTDVFDSVKSWCAAHGKPLPYFNIETKCTPATDSIYHPAFDEFSERLMLVIKKHRLEHRTIIQSFDFRTLQYIRAYYPEIPLAALVEDYDSRNLKNHMEDLGFIPEIYAPAYVRVNEALVAQCRYLGMKLIPWTVNDTIPAAKLKTLGVDGIITDYPDRIK